MDSSKKWRIAVQENAVLRKENKELVLSNSIKLKQIEDKDIEITQLKDRWTKLQSGSLVYTVDQDGYVDNMVLTPNDFITSYPQEIPKGFGTALYHNNRFIKIDNGTIVIDEVKYKRYLGGL